MSNEEKKRIEDYINTYRVYPKEYTGTKDKKIIDNMNNSYRFDTRTKTITRLEGRINDKGDFEIVGRFTFPIDKPEEKVKACPVDMAVFEAYYNRLMIDLGYECNVIGNNPRTEKWNLRDMISEIEYIRSTYYDKNHVNSKLRETDPDLFNKHTNRLRHFIREYKEYIIDMVAYTKHNSKYDN